MKKFTIIAVSLLIVFGCSKKKDAVQDMIAYTATEMSNAKEIAQKAEQDVVNENIVTTFKDVQQQYDVTWHIFKNKVHTNGYVIIDRIDFLRQSDNQVDTYTPADVSNDLDYMEQIKYGSTNMRFVYHNPFGDIKSFKEISDIINMANALIIVSYKHKTFDVSKYENEVNTIFKEIIKHQNGFVSETEIKSWK